MSRDMEQYDDSELPNLAAFAMSHDEFHPEFDADGHVEQGTVHAWLDNAFNAEDAARIAAHVATCAACQSVVAEARGLLAGSARILGALDGVPMSVVPQEDAARTAARIATAVPTPSAARVNARRWWPAAAAALLVVGTTSVWQRTRSTPAAETGAEPAATAPTATAPTPAAEPAAAAAPAVARAVAPASEPVTTRDMAPMAAPIAERARLRSAEKAAAPSADIAANTAPAAAPPRAPDAASAAAVGATEVARSTEPSLSVARTVVISGIVTASGRPVSDASVTARLPLGSATTQTTTDASGAYALRVPDVQRGVALEVMVRRIGYERVILRRIVSGDSLRVDVSLSASTLALSTVVTTMEPTRGAPKKAAEATATRTNVTGAAAAAPAPTSAPTSVPANIGVAGGIARAPMVSVPTTRRERVADELRQLRPQIDGGPNREQYDRISDNPFQWVRNDPLSTFSVDVDRAAYGNVRRFIAQGQRPPKDAVRIEELVNYFPYALPDPAGADPVSITTEVIAAPWQPQHQLVRIALQSRRIATANLPPNNLVFLIDVSGSMMDANKLPLVKQSLRLLVDQLRPQDRVAIVTYAGAAGLVLPSTSGDEKASIMEAIDRLEAGGSTAGGAGIMLAYRTAREHFLANGNNRVILATDGDFNVGASGGDLERLIELKRMEGTYLTILGFGTGNYQDATMEKLAKVGNGNYGYIDELNEARKMLVREMGATLLTVANDVKLQVEFNPATVQGYRLIGYEDRLLRNQDFNDDRKDAGDMGAGHQVTALYEIVPVGVTYTGPTPRVDSARYTTPAAQPTGARDELLYVKLRYKRPGDSASRLLQQAVRTRTTRGSIDTRFAAAVAQFGMLLRDSEHKGNSSAAQVLEQARAALGEDEGGYRAAFVELVERWRSLGRR